MIDVCFLQAKPLTPNLKKYGSSKGRYPLEFNDIRRCGRQILEVCKQRIDNKIRKLHVFACCFIDCTPFDCL